MAQADGKVTKGEKMTFKNVFNLPKKTQIKKLGICLQLCSKRYGQIRATNKKNS